jgi:hypothetical protein
MRHLQRSEGSPARWSRDLAIVRGVRFCGGQTFLSARSARGTAMLTAARVRELRGDGLALFRELGYDVAPVAIDPAEWRRAGIAIGWNGDSSFTLAARMRRFDLFHLRGDAEEEIPGREGVLHRRASRRTITATHSSAESGLGVDLRTVGCRAEAIQMI